MFQKGTSTEVKKCLIVHYPYSIFIKEGVKEWFLGLTQPQKIDQEVRIAQAILKKPPTP